MWPISNSGRIDGLIVFRALGGAYVPLGELRFQGSGVRRQGRFVYARSYLARAEKKPVDPIGLPLRSKSVAADPEEVPLVFHDVGPDGWGKEILTHAFPGLTLGMPEFLALGGLGRTGDLAFGPTPDGPERWVPDDEPLLDLPSDDDELETLMRAAAAVDAGDAEGHHFKLLFRKSADVGGARPKTRIRHEGKDWIAKFPTWSDTFDNPRLEAVCLDVAEAAGVPVPEHRIIVAGGKAALFVRRFDRSETDQPFGYISAATLLKRPSTEYATTMTYLDIATVARTIGVHDPERGLYRRLLLNAYLHNTDDHLHNHALIDKGSGWELSPAFDIVPHPDGRRHICAPAPGIGPEWNPDRAFEAHASLKISKGEAEAIRDEVLAAARRLPEFMDLRAVSARDRETLKDAFPAAVGFSTRTGATLERRPSTMTTPSHRESAPEGPSSSPIDPARP
ncbi:MAG: HipA domain-containing protein [Microvirga sp.]